MRLANIFGLIFIFLAGAGAFFSQTDATDENWLLELSGGYTNYSRIDYQFKTFTGEDVGRAKLKLKAIRELAPKDEWEGVYFGQALIGDERLIWNASGGFLNFYFYHRLKGLDYGRAFDSGGRVEFVSEKTANDGQRKTPVRAAFVKAKVGDVHFLVPENRLADFCKRAVGLNIADFDYWMKDADREKKIFGLPVLPPKYAALIRRPIGAKIIRIEIRKLVKRTSGETEIRYFVALGAGRDRNVKRGMNFFVEELGEWVRIEKVAAKSSTGFIRRDFDEANRERCFDGPGGQGEIIPCRKTAVGMKVETKASEL